MKINYPNLTIDLSALNHNLNYYKNISNNSTKIMLMLKANAYGFGLFEISKYFENKVEYFGLAFPHEAVELREKNINTNLVILNPLFNVYDVNFFLKYNLQPVIFKLEDLLFIENSNFSEQLNIHIKFNTGMNRYGFSHNEINDILKFLKRKKNINVISIMSHFAVAENDKEDPFSLEQINKFNQIYNKFVNDFNSKPMKTICNSPSVSKFKNAHYDMIRLGVGFYGFSFNLNERKNLKCSLVFKSVISQIRDIKATDTIGYSRNGKIKNGGRMAVVAMGYADGFRRELGNGKISVKINNEFCKTIGNVSMDSFAIDISNTKNNPKIGDEVIIFDDYDSIINYSNTLNTIPYEVFTSISKRVQRNFVYSTF